MYASFYGLSESPFALTPDPRYLFLSEPHKEALASATYGVQERKGFVLILGEVGTGKTTLIRHLLGRFGPNIKTVFVFNPAVSFLELLQLILRDLELPCPSVRRVEMIDTLNEFLLQEAAAGRYVVLIIDEAQHLSPTVLEEVRMLSNLETTRGKLLQILLVGQPELGEKLGKPELRQLRQRIGLVAELKPLSHKETVQYVAHRLEVAGRAEQNIFSSRALRIIHQASGGIPRLVNVICDKGLLLAYGAGSQKVGGRLVKHVLKDWAPFRRRAARPQGRSRRRPVARTGIHSWGPFWKVAGIALVGVAGTALYLMLAAQRQTEPPARTTPVVAARTAPTPAAAPAPAPQAPAATEPTLPPRLTAPAGSSLAVAALPPKPEPKPVASPRVETPPASPVSLPSTPASEPLAQRNEKSPEVVVKAGDHLSGLVTRAYGRADLTLLDFVKAANPQLDSIDVLQPGQRLKFPSMEPRTLVDKREGWAGYRVHVMTVWETQSPAFHDIRSSLEKSGRRVYVTPVVLTPSDTAYRVMVGDFAGRQEAENFYRSFRTPSGALTQLWR